MWGTPWWIDDVLRMSTSKDTPRYDRNVSYLPPNLPQKEASPKPPSPPLAAGGFEGWARATSLHRLNTAKQMRKMPFPSSQALGRRKKEPLGV